MPTWKRTKGPILGGDSFCGRKYGDFGTEHHPGASLDFSVDPVTNALLAFDPLYFEVVKPGALVSVFGPVAGSRCSREVREERTHLPLCLDRFLRPRAR